MKVIFDKIRKKLKDRSKGELGFLLLLASGIVWLFYAVCLFMTPNEEYVFSGQDLESDYGIYMENFTEGHGGGYYLDNSIEAPGTEVEDYSLLTISSPKMNLHREVMQSKSPIQPMKIRISVIYRRIIVHIPF